MANKVKHSDIVHFNQLYYECHSFAEVARKTGFSASTVSKYVDRNWRPAAAAKHITLDNVPPFNFDIFAGLDNYGELCVLSDSEKEGIKELWGEMDG